MDRRPILLVEDNDSDVRLTRRALDKNNLANPLVVARDGEEAVAMLLGEGGMASKGPDMLPALVLLDLRLPKMNGLEVLERIRGDARTGTIPVVVLTTSDEQQDLEAAYRLGVNSYVRKPVDFEAFVDATRQLGLYWLVLNVPPHVG